jgi:hypothetical protein
VTSRGKSLGRSIALFANILGTVLLYFAISVGSTLPVPLGAVPGIISPVATITSQHPWFVPAGFFCLFLGFAIGLAIEIVELCDGR